jgi:hypothetical protein
VIRFKYKAFRKQYLDCRYNGNLIEEKCIICGGKLLMCFKHGGQCMSGKCRIERATLSWRIKRWFKNEKDNSKAW